jgi:hypothetical protein
MARLLDDQPLRFIPELTQGHKSILIGTGLSVPYIPSGAKTMLVQAAAKDIRMTLDGTVPTAAIGFVLAFGDAPLLIELTKNIKPQFFGTDAASSLQYCFGI